MHRNRKGAAMLRITFALALLSALFLTIGGAIGYLVPAP